MLSEWSVENLAGHVEAQDTLNQKNNGTFVTNITPSGRFVLRARIDMILQAMQDTAKQIIQSVPHCTARTRACRVETHLDARL